MAENQIPYLAGKLGHECRHVSSGWKRGSCSCDQCFESVVLTRLSVPDPHTPAIRSVVTSTTTAPMITGAVRTELGVEAVISLRNSLRRSSSFFVMCLVGEGYFPCELSAAWRATRREHYEEGQCHTPQKLTQATCSRRGVGGSTLLFRHSKCALNSLLE